MSRILQPGLSILGNLLSPAGKRSKLAILIYHRVFPKPDPLSPGEPIISKFDWQMAVLRRHFTPLPLSEAAQRLATGTLPERAVSVTFDDGYADNYHEALPILRKWGIPATFFIATGYLNGGRMWNDTVIEAVRAVKGDNLNLDKLDLGIHAIDTEKNRCNALNTLLSKLKYLPPVERHERVHLLEKSVGEKLPDDLMMTSDQVKLMLSAGMEIGAHTVNHPILTSLSLQEAEKEIFQSREKLEDILGQSVTSFAYPNGRPGIDYDRSHVEAVCKAGFKVCVSTSWGCAHGKDDLLQLPRISTWDRTPFMFSARIIKSYMKRTATFV